MHTSHAVLYHAVLNSIVDVFSYCIFFLYPSQTVHVVYTKCISAVWFIFVLKIISVFNLVEVFVVRCNLFNIKISYYIKFLIE